MFSMICNQIKYVTKQYALASNHPLFCRLVQGVLCLLAWPAVAQASCADQLASLGVSSSVASFVDADTPSDACTKAVCTSTLASCSGTDNLVLVMSDEFSGDNQRFGVEKDNPIWTAEEVMTGMWTTNCLSLYGPCSSMCFWMEPRLSPEARSRTRR